MCMKFCVKQWLLRQYDLGTGLDKLTNVHDGDHKSKKDTQILKYDRGGTTENLGKNKYSTNAVEIIGHSYREEMILNLFFTPHTNQLQMD